MIPAGSGVECQHLPLTRLNCRTHIPAPAQGWVMEEVPQDCSEAVTQALQIWDKWLLPLGMPTLRCPLALSGPPKLPPQRWRPPLTQPLGGWGPAHPNGKHLK